MTQKGIHTWDLIVHYHRCPKCGYIIESRKDYLYYQGEYQKQLECGRCHESFSVIKKSKPSFGPLIGEPEPIEMEWKNKK